MFHQKDHYEHDAGHETLGRAAPVTNFHTVHFFEDDSLFLDSLSEFVGGAIGAGGVCIVAVSPRHARGLAERLPSLGIDIPRAVTQGRYIVLDAQELLDSFLQDGWPDEKLFFDALEGTFLAARAGLRRQNSSVVAFGEMVALLCEQQEYDAAFRLEQLWNELARRTSISLRCAYPMRLFADPARHEMYRQICGQHTEVIPDQSFTPLGAADGWRMVSSLQQQIATLNAALEQRQREMERRRQVEEKLRQTEALAESIVESSVDCVKVLDLEGRLLYLNSPGCQAMEIGRMEEIVGRRWSELWPESDRAGFEAALSDARRGSVGSFQGECRTLGGTLKSWDVKITPAMNANGEIIRLIAVSRDITELRVAQQAAIHAEKLATAGRMAATIAHEINNPLEAVTNFIYLAQSHEGLPSDVRGYLEIADRELTRVAHIARQTLGFYRSTSMSRVIAVSDLVRDALMIYERRLRNKDLQVEISVHPTLEIYGKDGELRQALLNVVANAIDACRPGGRIWLRAQKTRNWTNGQEPGIRFTLADNGIGMSPEVQRRLFAPFFTTKSEVGTGIGLWVTKTLIEQRGGYVHFRSRQGERCGTVMSFFLPSGSALAAGIPVTQA